MQAAADPSPVPVSWEQAQKRRALEAQQAMTAAIKQDKYAEALSHARTAAQLDPSNILVQEFLKVLEEKVSLDEGDDEEEAGEGGSEGSAEGEGESTSDEDDDEDDEEEETSSSEEEESEDDEDEATTDVPSTSSAAAHSGPPRRAGAGVDGVTDSVAALHLSHNDRHALRASLAKGIQDLKDKEAAKKIIADDPLLNF